MLSFESTLYGALFFPSSGSAPLPLSSSQQTPNWPPPPPTAARAAKSCQKVSRQWQSDNFLAFCLHWQNQQTALMLSCVAFCAQSRSRDFCVEERLMLIGRPLTPTYLRATSPKKVKTRRCDPLAHQQTTSLLFLTSLAMQQGRLMRQNLGRDRGREQQIRNKLDRTIRRPCPSTEDLLALPIIWLLTVDFTTPSDQPTTLVAVKAVNSVEGSVMNLRKYLLFSVQCFCATPASWCTFDIFDLTRYSNSHPGLCHDPPRTSSRLSLSRFSWLVGGYHCFLFPSLWFLHLAPFCCLLPEQGFILRALKLVLLLFLLWKLASDHGTFLSTIQTTDSSWLVVCHKFKRSVLYLVIFSIIVHFSTSRLYFLEKKRKKESQLQRVERL